MKTKPTLPIGLRVGHAWGLAAVAAVVAGAWLAYQNSLSVPFLFDDHSAIVNNPTIRRLWPLGEVLSPPESATGVIGRPLVNLSLAVNHAIGGLNPAGYHRFNLAFHALSGVLLLGIMHHCLGQSTLRERYGRPALLLATAVAVLWTVHPLQTESVTCTVQRSEVLGGFFCLLTLYFFLRSIGSAVPGAWQTLTVLAALLGTQTKEIIVAVPVIALVLDRLFYAGSWREAWRLRHRVYLGFLGSWVVLAFVIARQGERGNSVGFGLGVSAWDYLLTQSQAIARYLGLAVWPHPLILDYGDGLVAGLTAVWPQALLVSGLVIITGAFLWRGRGWAMAGVWFFTILAPSSSFVPLTTQTIAEHRMYLPLAAVMVGAVLGLFELQRSRRWFVPVVLVLAGVLAFATWRRNEQYQTAIGIWTDTVAKRPGNPRAWINLGRACELEGQPVQAIAHYREALRVRAAAPEAHYNLANVLARTGDLAGAVRHYEESLRLQPGQPSACNNLGLAYGLLGRSAEAMTSFEAAVRLDPGHTGARFNWAQELAGQKRPAEAAALLAACVEARPDHPRYRLRLGEVLLVLGRIPEAIDQLEAAAKLPPPGAPVKLALGRALLAANRPLDAVPHLESAMRLQPELPGLGSTLRMARQLARQSENR